MSFSCFAFSSKWDQLLKERICSYRSKFFPLKADPFFKGFVEKESKQGVTEVVSLCKSGAKHGGPQFTFMCPNIYGKLKQICIEVFFLKFERTPSKVWPHLQGRSLIWKFLSPFK